MSSVSTARIAAGRLARRVGLWLAVGTVLGPMVGAVAMAQRERRDPDQRCRLEVVRVRRQGVRVETAPGVVNMFAGGDVHVRCVGQNVNMFADSVAIFGESVAQFIGRVRYRDSVTAIDADFGQYNKVTNDEYFDAQGNVRHEDVRSGSTIEGPRVIYYRALERVRPDGEVMADQRPTVKYVLADSAATDREPYVIVGDWVKLAGSDFIQARGRVTVDRSDLTARSDTLWIDSGERSAGQLLGGPGARDLATMRGVGRDSFELVGRGIDLRLSERRLSGLKARTSARLVGQDVTLEADSIDLGLVDGNVEETAAWGKERRPHAVSADYEVRGDSLRILSPDRRLAALRTWGDGWVGLKPDSGNGERDWIAGRTVAIDFASRDSSDGGNAVRQIEAVQGARIYYRMAAEEASGKASVNYTRADTIVVVMKVTADSNTVERVQARGNVDGIHLQPAVRPADTTAADSLRRAPGQVRRPAPAERRPGARR